MCFSFAADASPRLSDVMQFICGTSSVPPCGTPAITLEFKHGCERSPSGTLCQCLPTANTCSQSLTLPIHSDTQKIMTDSFSMAIVASKKYGFGLA